MKTRLKQIARSLTAWLLSAVLLSAILSAACGSESQVAEQDRAEDKEKAPTFELPVAQGGMLSLSQLLDGREAVTLVFYRGFF